ncbi:hypothetical protein N8Z10_00625 [bacterium]|nr:hypothetical protein [bacterium]
MEEWEEVFNEENETETIKMEAEQKILLKELKIRLAIENYNRIMDNGIDVNAMRNHGIDETELTNTINQMLDIFVELEEYEKCADLRNVLEQI